MLFMGVDIGSSGCKVSVINETGSVVCSSSRQYSFSYSDGRSELDAKKVFESVLEAIGEISLNNDLSSLATLSAASFGEMFVLLDGNGESLCNSISYSDPRGKEELKSFLNVFGSDRLYSLTGAAPDEMYSLGKLLWIKENLPLVYSKAEKICLFADFVLHKLGAEHHMDYSLASRTLMFDVRKKRWADDVIECAGIKRSIFPVVLPSGTVIGNIDKRIAETLRLPSDLKLLVGGHDQCCAALGAGITEGGTALDGMGSNECIVPVFDSPLIDNKMKQSFLPCVPYVLDGKYATYAFNRSSGTVIDWYRHLLGNVSYDELFGEMKDEPSRILCLPHFSGAATPYMDDSAVGAFSGLDLSCGRGELTKGIIDGLNYEMKINLECLRSAGFAVTKLYAAGGLSQNDKILQTKADILGVDICRLETPQTGTMAMAVLGTVAVGAYKDVCEAISSLVRMTEVFHPDFAKSTLYNEQFEKYKRMYGNVKAIEGRA